MIQKIHQQLVQGIQKYFKKTGFSRGVIGISGGIDSALTLKLGVDALGAKNITAISMPELDVSSEENINHARNLCQKLGVTFLSQPINPFLKKFEHLAWKPNQIAHQNTKARIRAVLLYNYANTACALVLGTSNKSEILLGYGTKYGDLAADLEVIGELFKNEVYALAQYLGLTDEIIKKKPTAELFKGQTDEDELGASYEQLDPILKKLKLGENGLIKQGFDPQLVQKICRRVQQNSHKSKMPPILQVKKIA